MPAHEEEAGRGAREDVLLGLMKTCAKLGVALFAHLGHRLGAPETAAMSHRSRSRSGP